VIENDVRKTYSARYYNPNTGRFMSRDPEDGKATDPASLHKYLYADGDPVNGLDRTGKADLYEWAAVAAITYVVFQPVHMFIQCGGLGRAGTVIGFFGPLLGDGIAAAFAYAYAALQGLSCW
jgi:RHS repeat-associated protein